MKVVMTSLQTCQWTDGPTWQVHSKAFSIHRVKVEVEGIYVSFQNKY